MMKILRKNPTEVLTLGELLDRLSNPIMKIYLVSQFPQIEKLRSKISDLSGKIEVHYSKSIEELPDETVLPPHIVQTYYSIRKWYNRLYPEEILK